MEKIRLSKINSGYTFVDNAEGLEHLTQMLRSTARAGVDTEADSLHHYFEKVCLIQLSFSGRNFIIDPLAGFSLTEFFTVLSEKELIFQGADYDLRLLKKSFGFRPAAPIFDTMIAAQVLGYEKIGLAALVERFFGVVMSKTAQKADWSKRPLQERLLTYAADDTKYLEMLADLMSEHLQKLNRTEWHKECCERVVKTSDLPNRNKGKEEWRVKGSSKLSPDALVFVRALWKWRDEEAQQKDRPAFMILRNEDLVALALWRAKNPQAPLREGPSFLKRFTGEKGARLENTLKDAKNIPAEEWPEPLKKKDWKGPHLDEGKLDQLIASCKTIAAGLGIEPSFLASRDMLKAVVRHRPSSIETMMEVSGLMRWQANLIEPAVRKVFGNLPGLE